MLRTSSTRCSVSMARLPPTPTKVGNKPEPRFHFSSRVSRSASPATMASRVWESDHVPVPIGKVWELVRGLEFDKWMPETVESVTMVDGGSPFVGARRAGALCPSSCVLISCRCAGAAVGSVRAVKYKNDAVWHLRLLELSGERRAGGGAETRACAAGRQPHPPARWTCRAAVHGVLGGGQHGAGGALLVARGHHPAAARQ